MDHLIILNATAKEIEELINGTRSMVIHGSDEDNDPYGKIARGDVVYLTYENGDRNVKARAIADKVYNSGSLSEDESYKLIIDNQDKLMLKDEIFYRWAGKKFLVLVSLKNVELVVQQKLSGIEACESKMRTRY